MCLFLKVKYRKKSSTAVVQSKKKNTSCLHHFGEFLFSITAILSVHQLKIKIHQDNPNMKRLLFFFTSGVGAALVFGETNTLQFGFFQSRRGTPVYSHKFSFSERVYMCTSILVLIGFLENLAMCHGLVTVWSVFLSLLGSTRDSQPFLLLL